MKKALVYSVLTLLVSLLPPSVSAGEEREGGLFRRYLSDTQGLLSPSPRGGEEGWSRGLLFLGVTAGLYGEDDKIRRWMQDRRSRTGDHLSDVVRNLGDGRYLLPPLGLFYLYGRYGGDGRAAGTASIAFESFLISGIATQIIKGAAHRHRPYTEDGRDHWDGPSVETQGDYLSFPSGHAQTAFSIATVFARQYGETPAVPLIAYGAAGLVALQRVYDDKHWASDVFVGSAIGYWTASRVVDMNGGGGGGRYVLLPFHGGSVTGLMVVVPL